VVTASAEFHTAGETFGAGGPPGPGDEEPRAKTIDTADAIESAGMMAGSSRARSWGMGIIRVLQLPVSNSPPQYPAPPTTAEVRSINASWIKVSFREYSARETTRQVASPVISANAGHTNW